jgi:hypothetical protein
VTSAGDARRIADVVAGPIERVFGTVAEIHAAARDVARDPAGDASGTMLATRVRGLLGSAGQLAVGLGLVVAPGPQRELQLRWWQTDPATGRLVALHPDLRPASLGFYDYTTADWFDVPRRTGARHVVGPYVDVHGTGQYLLTFTAPVIADGQFLGVVGADVPVSRFESHLLRELGAVEPPFLLLDDEGRVVLSTSPRWLVGALTGPPEPPAAPGVRIEGAPWRLHLTGGRIA